MTRAIQWLLGVLGFIALMVSILVGYAHGRAQNAYLAHVERLSADTRTLRAHHSEARALLLAHAPFRKVIDLALAPDEGMVRRALVALAGFRTPGDDLRDALRLNAEGVFVRYEEATETEVGRSAPSGAGLDETIDPEMILAALALAQEVGRGRGILLSELRMIDEACLLTHLEVVLGARSFSCLVLASLAEGMDRIIIARPRFEDILPAQTALTRSYRLKLAHERTGFSFDEGWRNLYSRKIGAVRELNDISGSISLSDDLYALDGRMRLHLAMARIVIAALHFRSEQGRLPETPEALVPKYLPAVPRCPVTNEPFKWDEGILLSPSGNDSWTIKRK